jgi:sporulation protein YlmC with PRC-barrel domain
MAETTRFRIGAKVSCADGACGEVIRVVVDPVASAVTHLAVRPTHHRALERLVPFDLVEATDGGGVHLSCTAAEFDKLDAAEEVHLMPGDIGIPANRRRLPLQFFMVSPPSTFASETVPYGEVDLRHGDKVHATDGEIGHVEGLLVDPSDHRVTHVLLQEGHLWGRKQVAIPIDVVKKFDGRVDISLTKQQVHDLPPVDIDHASK